MTAEQRLLATQLIAGPKAVISHMTAARRHKLDVPRTELVDVTVPHTCLGARYDDARIYRSRHLGDEDVELSGVLRVTRTVIDLASILKGTWLSALVYSALRQGKEMGSSLFIALLSHKAGRKGARRLEALLARQTGELGIPRSAAEAFFNELSEKAGVRPVAQYKVGPHHHVDFAFPDHRVVVEVDSWAHHSSFHAYRTDRRRDVATIRDGWTPLRFTWHDVITDRANTVRAVLDVLERHSPQGSLFPRAALMG
jgi:very-short-patch-repair endonuclease